MFSRFRIGQRLGGAFGIVLLLLVLTNVVGLRAMDEMAGYTEKLSNNSVRQLAGTVDPLVGDPGGGADVIEQRHELFLKRALGLARENADAQDGVAEFIR